MKKKKKSNFMMISAVGVVRLFPFLDLCVEFPFSFSFIKI